MINHAIDAIETR